MRRRKTWRVFVYAAGSLALAMALGRCSPLAPSLPKSTYADGQPGNLVSQNGNPNSVSLQPPFETQILDGPSYVDAVGKLPGETRVVALSAEQTAEFAEKGSVTVAIAGPPPGSGTALMEIAGTNADFVLPNFDQLRTRLTRKDGSWILSLAPDSSGSLWQILKQRLVGITLSLDGPVDVISPATEVGPANAPLPSRTDVPTITPW